MKSRSQTWPEQLTHFKNLTYISWLWTAFTSRKGRARYAPVIFLRHWDCLSVENPTGHCQPEPAAALWRGENEDTRQMGRGEWEDGWAARESQKMNEWMLMGYDKAGGWEDHGHGDAFFPRTNGAVMHSTRRSLIPSKEQSLQQGVDALRKGIFSQMPGLNLASELKPGNKESSKSRAVVGPPGLLGVCWHSNADWGQGQGGQVFF